MIKGSEPLVVYVEGSYNLSSRLRIGSNKSLIGTKKGASFVGTGNSILKLIPISNFYFYTVASNNILDHRWQCLGETTNALLGITIQASDNVILRNLQISFVLDNDGITIQNSTRVWIDHNELFSDLDHGPDYYVHLRLSRPQFKDQENWRL